MRCFRSRHSGSIDAFIGQRDFPFPAVSGWRSWMCSQHMDTMLSSWATLSIGAECDPDQRLFFLPIPVSPD